MNDPSTFNKSHYDELMDGLECNEIMLSSIGEENPYFRIDAEFFQKSLLELNIRLQKMQCIYLNKENLVSGPFGSTLKSSSFLESGDVPFVRIENIKGGFYINTDSIIYISDFDNNRLSNSELTIDDIVLSKVGNTIGYFARVDEKIKKCNISENNIGIKLRDFSKEQKHYILTYLNCKFAQNLVIRRKSGNAQPKLNVDDMTYIPIPLFSDRLYMIVSELINKSRNILTQSHELYKETTLLLEDSLGFTNFEEPNEVYSTKLISSSFSKSGRLDAEYYQNKYEKYATILNTADTVRSLCNLYDKNFIPNVNECYNYIELSDVGRYGDISNIGLSDGCDLPTRARRKVKSGQVIVSSIEGSLSSCALITSEYNDAICSNGFYVVDSDSINSETLLVLFKSKPIQALLKQRCSGTILTSINKDEFLDLPLPRIKSALQEEIAVMVQKTFEFRKKAKEILNKAINIVETAIEKGEEEALKLF